MTWSVKNRLHLIISSIGLASMLVAFWAIVANKDAHGKAHFTSWHGQIGFCSGLLLCLLWLNGLVAHFLKVKTSRRLHKTCSLLITAAYLSAFCLGLWSNWALANIHPALRAAALPLPLIPLFKLI